jgi:hypothetical protein
MVIARSFSGDFMKKTQTTSLDEERAEPLGDTGDGDTGVPDGEQGISNRAGDKHDDPDGFEEDDLDELEDEQEEEEEDGGA